MSKRTLLVLRTLLILAIAAILTFIYYHSTRVGNSSAYFSQAATSKINQILSFLHMDGVFSEGAVRKMAHFGEYWLLGFLTCALFLTFPKMHTFWSICLPLVGGISAAGLDEWIQRYTPGRNGQVMDVILDGFGVCLGIFVALFFFFLVTNAKNQDFHKRI
ncbi:VanZ family protein [Massilimaliae timonensis]|uniref:VanZ family protein n=1 Tax=Massiliimalia timonensis TaxID=1987501 RepID=A0A8J6NZJ9_9FIRM|nr:VanZ family protein [Massiliimalia timonensis]MBC8610191.1 VanZ family protein [Massiliimalia timonensis]